MVLHLGNGYITDTDEIIGVFDLENTTVNPDTRGFLKTQTDNGDIIDVSDDIPKSFVVTEQATYLCQLSVQTFAKRMKNGKFGL